MKMWVKAGEEKKVLEGSLYKVMKEIKALGDEGKELQLLSVHTNHWERRRWRKWYRRAGRDLKKAAEEFINWVESSPALMGRFAS